jgi:hypothetical protein
MANFLERAAFEEVAKFRAQKDGRNWDELPGSVKELYVDKSIQNVENLKKELKEIRRLKEK